MYDNKLNVKRTALRITMLGDSKVGKTSIVNVFLNLKFVDDNLSTIGKMKLETMKEMKDGKKMKIIILDTAGQERFHSITTSSIKGSNGIVVTFDRTDKTSFKNVENWLNDIQDIIENIPIVLFGNKSDLEDKRVVQKEDIDNFLKAHPLTYFETSAKLDINIKEGFKKIIDDAYESVGGAIGQDLNNVQKNKK